MLKNIIFVLICGYFSAPALGANQSPSLIKDISFNLGNHTEFYNAIQNDDSGGLRKFDFAPVLGFGLNMPINDSWSFLPEFNWVLPQFLEDSHIIVNTFMYRADFGYNVLDWLRLRVGTSLIQMNLHGRGGKTKERNGAGSSSFYYPDENRSALNNTFDAGVEGLYDRWGLRLQTYTYSIFKEERRQISYTIFLTYYWEK